MTNREFKIELIKQLMERPIFTQKVSDINIRTRCPYCGDSVKNQNTGHFYIRISPNDNLPILYNCFRCPAHGIVDKDVLEELEIQDKNLLNDAGKVAKTSDKNAAINPDRPAIIFNYELPENYEEKKIRYIENRLGRKFNEQDLKDCKVITSLREFLLKNDIHTITVKPEIANFLDRDFVGFVTSTGTQILFRSIRPDTEIRWFKYSLILNESLVRPYYAISSAVDLFTPDDITINISEGVFDCMGIAYGLNEIKENTLNLATCGKFYGNMMKTMMQKGFVGNNIIYHIYADNDGSEGTDIDYLRRTLTQYLPLTKTIYIHYNILEKDCGVRADRIKLKTYEL